MSKTRRQLAQDLVDRSANEGASAPMRTGSTVTVACKLPHGLQLQLCEMTETRVPSLGGTTLPVKQAVKIGKVYTVNGNASPHGVAPRCRIVAGYALTDGIPKEFWDKWREQNEDAEYVTHKLIMAWPTNAGADDMAKEHRRVRSGLEPLDGQNLKDDPRVPRKLPGGSLHSFGEFDGKQT